MELFAVSNGVAIAYAVGLWVVLIVMPATITALKGQWALFGAGWFTLGLVWLIYNKRARSQSRYGATVSDSTIA